MSDPRLHVARVSLIVELIVPERLLLKFLPASVKALGKRVTEQVVDYCQQQNLNYYPPLDYIKQQQAIDTYLIDALDESENTAILICKNEIGRLLVPVFSNVKMVSAQCLAFTMPTCRPGKNIGMQSASLNILAQHYTPNNIKIQLLLSSLQRKQVTSGFEKYVSSTVYRWLSEEFEAVKISAARLVNDGGV